MARKKSGGTGKNLSFEEALARLEEIVRLLEEADLPLEKALAVFEEGVRLSRFLHEKLDESERQVEILLQNKEGGKIPVPFCEAPGEEPGAPGEAAVNGEEEEGDDGAGGAAQTGFGF
jgi:exodeoxyribonuclease VII small subunit